MVCLGTKKLGDASPWIGPKIGHSYEAFTYLFCRNISIRLSAKKRFFCRCYEISKHEKLRNNPLSWDSTLFISSETCKNLGVLVESEFSCGCFFQKMYWRLLREDKWRNCGYFCKTGRPMWMLHMSDQSWNNSGGLTCCRTFFLPGQNIKVKALFQW